MAPIAYHLVAFFFNEHPRNVFIPSVEAGGGVHHGSNMVNLREPSANNLGTWGTPVLVSTNAGFLEYGVLGCPSAGCVPKRGDDEGSESGLGPLSIAI